MKLEQQLTLNSLQTKQNKNKNTAQDQIKRQSTGTSILTILNQDKRLIYLKGCSLVARYRNWKIGLSITILFANPVKVPS